MTRVYPPTSKIRSDQWTARCQSSQMANRVARKVTTTNTRTTYRLAVMDRIAPPLFQIPPSQWNISKIMRWIDLFHSRFLSFSEQPSCQVLPLCCQILADCARTASQAV